MPSTLYAMWPLIALGSFVGLGLVTYFGNRYSRPTAFHRAKAQLAAGAPDLVDGAVVTLVGTVKPIELLKAPITGRPCVALHVKAMIGPHWLTRFAMTRFTLETPQGEVVVEHWPDAALGFIPVEPNPSMDVAARFLAGIGYSPMDATRARWREIAIVPGQRIAVFGVVRTGFAKIYDRTPESGFRENPTVMRLVGDPDHPLAMGEPEP